MVALVPPDWKIGRASTTKWGTPVSLREAVHRAEEGLIAAILGVMTVLTFVQVVLRYVFNSGFIWQLEANFYLFSWLVMLGISNCVRVRAHIGGMPPCACCGRDRGARPASPFCCWRCSTPG
jgi:hypothetical protein